jgi:hypothetical protein
VVGWGGVGHGGVLCLGVRCGSLGSSVLLRKGKEEEEEEEESCCLSVEEATNGSVYLSLSLSVSVSVSVSVCLSLSSVAILAQGLGQVISCAFVLGHGILT